MSLLNTAISGINAYQKHLDVIGNNISNANTPGYSRQEVVLSSALSIDKGYGYQGTGVQIDDIRRLVDQFAIEQLRTDTQVFKGYESYKQNVEQINKLLGDERTGLNSALNEYFSALQTAAEDPGFIPSREAFLGATKVLQDRFNVLHDRLTDMNNTVNKTLRSNVADINSLASSIAELNDQIHRRSNSSSSTGQPNQLLDQRDELVRELSEIIDLDVVDTGQGLDIFIANGQSLVSGFQARRLETGTSERDVTQDEVFFRNSTGQRVNITDRIEGGTLGGTLKFRADSLNSTLNSLGRIGVGIGELFNAQQARGINLEGQFGSDLFTDFNDQDLARKRVQANSTNSRPQTGTAEVYIKDVGDLTTSDYELRMTGPLDFGYEIVRLDSGEVVKSGALAGERPESLEFDGLELRLVDGDFRAGDSFLIKPTRDAAGDFKQVLTRPAELAFAAPITGSGSLANQGSGRINQGEILDVTSPAFEMPGELSPPLLIVFESENTYSVLDNSDPLRPRNLEPPMRHLPFSPGASNDMLRANPGETQVTSYSGWLPTVPHVQPADQPDFWPDNEFNAERVTFETLDEEGKPSLLERISTEKGASAREVASSLSGVPGVSARAFTEVELTNFQSALPEETASDPVEVFINGVDLTISAQELGDGQKVFDDDFIPDVPIPMTPEFLANRINTNWELQDAGITARSDGESLRILSADGDDIRIELRANGITGATGSRPDSFEVSNGQEVMLSATGADTRGLLTESQPFDFSERGPYTYEFTTPYGEPASIELTENYESADEMMDDIAQKIEQELISQERIKRNDPWLNGADAPGRVEASIDEQGQISFKVLMKMEGLPDDDSQKLTMGGTVDVVMEEGVRMRTEPDRGNLFPGQPEQLSTFLGYQFQVDGRPEAGDRFEIDFNRDPSGDNRNADRMLDLQTDRSINRQDGGMNFTEAYSQLAEQVGVRTRQAQINTDAAKVSKEQTENRIQEVSGVNLDEEAARMLRFEQGYNASAQMIKVAQDIFTSLLGAFR
ncbi:flagellar hook-associated protein FlgK [Natronospirillum operosum]|uniref:Flagellar hook-associated protein 1 n=1 Tax=Natronospirillum operosum TaxID=2759953 RepID=A0A4Z0WKS9_9GAMM|nr:flagellar hook-associated protein FlgK [Natronospirillum operosum]TGG95991.1 flagellar hook-associated protein FlgK [Natronospirillum operosum]